MVNISVIHKVACSRFILEQIRVRLNSISYQCLLETGITGRSRWKGVVGIGGVSSSATVGTISHKLLITEGRKNVQRATERQHCKVIPDGFPGCSWCAGGVSGGVRGGASLGFNVSPWG